MTLLPDEPLKLLDGEEIDNEAQREVVRRMMRSSTLFLGKAILGVNIASARTHKKYCEFVEDDSIRKKVTLMPRGTLKTTLGTETDATRRVLDDENVRILLASNTIKNARAMLKVIKANFTQNEKLRFFFPERCHLDTNAKDVIWNQDEMQVPRSANWPEPTIQAVGVGAEIVSRHFTVFKFDDLIGRSAIDSPAVMEDAINWLTYSTSLAANQSQYVMHLNGTRYGVEDLYSHAINKMKMVPFIRKAIVINPYTKLPEPFFPALHSLEELEGIIETDPFQWATQYANDPFDTNDADFQVNWLKYYQIAPDGDIRYTDDSGYLHKQNINELTVYIHVDPGGEGKKSDPNAIVVVGVNSRGLIFILATEFFNGDPLDLIDRIFVLDKRFEPKLISIEAVAYQRHIKAFVESRMRKENRYLRIENFQPGSRQTKATRIRRRLQPFFASTSIYTRPAFTELISEYTHFSDRSHPHLLDALAQGPEYWKTPIDASLRKKLKKLEATPINRGRTGYGV